MFLQTSAALSHANGRGRTTAELKCSRRRSKCCPPATDNVFMRPHPPAGPARSPLPGFILMVALVALAAGAKTVLYDSLDPDCFWHLRVGQQLLDEGIHPLRDTLSFAS